MSTKSRITRVTFPVKGVDIDINYQTVSPDSESINNESTIILLPGWSINAHANSAKIIAKAFAQISNNKVIIIDTKPSKIIKDTLYLEALAIKNLIEKSGVKKIIIAGYSEGGIKAVNLTTILQKNPEIEINGLALMEPMGLYTQESKVKVVGGFIKDTFLDTPISIAKRVLLRKDASTIKTALTAGSDILSGMANEIKRSKADYPQKITSQLNEMFYKSKRLKEITVPVILIQGLNDPVSNPKKLIPDFEKLDEKTSIDKRGYKNPYREAYLKKHVFIKSPFIRMLVGKKVLPTHAMPVEDAMRITRASISLIKEANNKK